MNDYSKDAPTASRPASSPAPVMTPREIVSELDRYIVGQKEAKRAVAIALRNRWRRQLVPEDLREDDGLRAEVSDKLKDIMDKMGAFYAAG